MKKILIVVDYQNDFVNGSLGFAKAETLDEGIAAKVREFKNNGDTVIFTHDTHFKDYLETQEGKNLPVEHCEYGSFGWQIYGETGKVKKDTISLIKHSFGSLELVLMLKSFQDENAEIQICGVVTNICVISNAVIAKTALPEAKIIILENLCASFDEELHTQAINVMKSLQMEVRND